MRWLLSSVGVLALVVLGWSLLVWFAQRSMMYPAPPLPHGSGAATRPDLVPLELETGAEAWLLPAVERSTPGPAVIFAHGNGELIDFWLDEFEPLRERGVAVLLVEYPGYGRSPGSPSQASITAAFVDAYDALVARPEVRGDAVVGYGRSLGGGAVCQLATRRSLAGLILESSFTGVAPIARRMAVPRSLVRDPFDNVAVLRAFDGPVLVLHGERDRIIPFAHGRDLAAAARGATLHAMPCGHNDCARPWPPLFAFLEDASLLD